MKYWFLYQTMVTGTIYNRATQLFVQLAEVEKFQRLLTPSLKKEAQLETNKLVWKSTYV